MKKGWLFTILVVVLFALEILRVYFIMPFPGSQRGGSLALAYFLNRWIWWIRIPGWAVSLFLATSVWSSARRWQQGVFILGIGGAYLDKYLATSPLFTILGLSLALTTSILWVWKVVKRAFPGKPTS